MWIGPIGWGVDRLVVDCRVRSATSVVRWDFDRGRSLCGIFAMKKPQVAH